MTRWICAILLAGMTSSFALGQGINIRDYYARNRRYYDRKNRQRITDLTPVKAPTVDGAIVGEGKAKGVVLNPKNWKRGMCFTDQKGRQWQLAAGCPIKGNPQNVNGWVIRTKDNSPVLFYNHSKCIPNVRLHRTAR